MIKDTISFRRIESSDMEFLSEVYASTRREELAQANWTDEAVEAFLKSQFQMQHDYYQKVYSSAEYEIIISNDDEIGRLYTDRRDGEIRIVDIAMLPAYRGMGYGNSILRDILDEAAEKNISVRIHVERNNPALSLYKRLGFYQIEDKEMYLLLEWSPSD